MCNPEDILSSSPFALGLIAPRITASGISNDGITTLKLFELRVFPVWVSFSFTTAPMSPALSLAISFLFLPLSTKSWPTRSDLSLLVFIKSIPALIEPE